MTARIYPVDMVAGAPLYAARAWRQLAVAPFLGGATTGRPLGGRSGVRPGTGTPFVVTNSTTITIGAFAGIIDGESAGEAAPYTFSFDAATNVTIQAANSSNPRVDLISVQVSDPAESDGSSAPSIALVYTAGSPAASPLQPGAAGSSVAAPARSFPVLRVNVPVAGGGNPTGTWIAPYAVAAGGVLPVDTLANRPSNPTPGQLVDVYGEPLYINNGLYKYSPGYTNSSQPNPGYYPVAVLARRYYYSAWNLGSTANGAILASYTFDPLPFPFRAIWRVDSQGGNGAAARRFAVNVTPTAGSTNFQAATLNPVQTNTGAFQQFSTEGFIDVPANTAVAITAQATLPDGNVVTSGMLSAKLLFAGEY